MAAWTAPTVSAGGLWKTPSPSAGSSTPLFNVIEGVRLVVCLVSRMERNLRRACRTIYLPPLTAAVTIPSNGQRARWDGDVRGGRGSEGISRGRGTARREPLGGEPDAAAARGT